MGEVARLHPLAEGEVRHDCAGCLQRDDKISGLKTTINSQAGLLGRLKRALDDERFEGEENQTVVRLFEVWQRATGHSNTMLGDDRVKAIKDALKLCRKDRKRQAKAGKPPKLSPEEIVELALEGIGAFPYVVNGQRAAHGTEAQCHDRIGIALDGSENIERFANLGHRSRSERGAA